MPISWTKIAESGAYTERTRSISAGFVDNAEGKIVERDDSPLKLVQKKLVQKKLVQKKKEFTYEL